MNLQDVVYGSTTISEPVLLDLMQSDAVQRLRKVLQHGISGLIGLTRPTTRYEHSVGAMIMVRRYGGTLTEQIAALLHDVSHTAFSHVIDYVFDGHDSQSYHDEKKEEYLATTDVPALLNRHGYDWRAFLDDEAFALLEQPSPRLCADRLDYFLRDSLDLALAQPADISRVLGHLVVAEARLATDDIDVARWLAETYMAADDTSWANWQEVGLYELTAQAIRRGLDVGAIDDSHIWSTDAVVWQRMKAHGDSRLQELLRQITPETQFVWDDIAPTFRISTKVRTIDPDIVGEDGRLQPLSQLDPQFKQRRVDYLSRKQGKWPMRVIALE